MAALNFQNYYFLWEENHWHQWAFYSWEKRQLQGPPSTPIMIPIPSKLLTQLKQQKSIQPTCVVNEIM